MTADDITPTRVAQLECNIDDMTAEALGYVLEQLLAHGALDAWFTPITMKKGRPATLLSLLCRVGDVDEYCDWLLRETSTLGVRWHLCDRRIAQRTSDQVETPWGPVRRKLKLLDDVVISAKPEYDDCARIAHEHRIPIQQVIDAARRTPWHA